MNKNILLFGDSGVGKSTLLLKLLQKYLNKASGFATIRLYDDNNTTVAFQQVSANDYYTTITPYLPELNNIIIDFTKHIKSIDTFHNFTIPSITNENCSFILMDEIGGFEIMDKTVFNAYLKALRSDKPCIGVIKSIPLNSHLRVMPNKKEYVDQFDSFIKLIQETDTLLLNLNHTNLIETQEILQEWINSTLI